MQFSNTDTQLLSVQWKVKKVNPACKTSLLQVNGGFCCERNCGSALVKLLAQVLDMFIAVFCRLVSERKY